MRQWLSRVLPGSASAPAGAARVDEWMREAFDAHQAGEWSRAEEAYRRILAAEPDNVDALYLRGEIAKRTGRIDAALEWIGKAAALRPETALFHQELAALHETAGDAAAAYAGYARVLELEPHNLEALIGQGIVQLALDRTAQAVHSFEEALKLDPTSLAALVNLGSALQHCGRLADAAARLEAALRIDPHCVQALSNLGGVRIKQNEYAAARELIDHALRIDPLFMEARMNLGILLLKQWRVAEARSLFEDAARSRPEVPLVHYNLARVHRKAGQLDKAIESFRDSLRLSPDAVETHLDLGRALQEDGQVAEAIAHYRKAVERKPEFALAHLRLGYGQESVGDLPGAMLSYERTLELDPEFIQAHVNRAVLNLLRGEYARGWEEYEWRLREPLYDAMHRRFPLPQWGGSPLQGRGVLAYAEQGLGDEIMYASCLPELAARADRVVLDCEPRLAALLRRSFPTITVHGGTQVESGDWLRELPKLDCKVPIASLPFRLGRTGSDFPAHHGYLKADPAQIESWRARLAELGPGLRVGLSWRGGVPKTGRALRSIALEGLLPILRQPGCRFVSLQYGECREELTGLRQAHGISVHHWQEAIEDFDQTAALACALDLVISVCTTAVHLVGALGRPVWVLVPLKPESRYGLRGETMAWYPSARLFRQKTFGEWQPVVDEVARALAGKRESEGGAK